MKFFGDKNPANDSAEWTWAEVFIWLTISAGGLGFLIFLMYLLGKIVIYFES